MRLYYQIDQNSRNMESLCKLGTITALLKLKYFSYRIAIFTQFIFIAACENPSSIELCDVYSNPRFGNLSQLYPLNWRFLSVLDSQVDSVLIRDLDSLPSFREISAVNEYLNSSKVKYL